MHRAVGIWSHRGQGCPGEPPEKGEHRKMCGSRQVMLWWGEGQGVPGRHMHKARVGGERARPVGILVVGPRCQRRLSLAGGRWEGGGCSQPHRVSFRSGQRCSSSPGFASTLYVTPRARLCFFGPQFPHLNHEEVGQGGLEGLSQV